MSVSMKPEDARAKRICPVSAIIGTDKDQTPFCHGHVCGAWRWTLDEAYRAAVAAEAKRTVEKPPFAKAAATVAAKPITYGLRGYCGLGGQP